MLLMACFVLTSCSKLGLCHDAELGFSRQSNISNKIRLDGYFYEDSNGTGYSKVYLLYQNGVSYNGLSSTRIKDIENNSFAPTVNKDVKSGWGVYRIEGNHIEFQNWVFSVGCKPVITRKGTILNDTTIKLTSWQNSNSDESNNINTILLFHKYSPKPDSTNNFIP